MHKIPGKGGGVEVVTLINVHLEGRPTARTIEVNKSRVADIMLGNNFKDGDTRFEFHGKETTISFGSYGEVTIPTGDLQFAVVNISQ